MSQNQGDTRSISILLVEDNLGDVELTLDAFEEGKIRNNVNVVHDGEQAMDYLNARGEHVSAQLPDLIFMDLNMPKMGGKEVLQQMRQDERLKHIPVVILTSSEADRDVADANNDGANYYIVKPVDVTKLMDVVQKLGNLWFDVVKLPPKVA